MVALGVYGDLGALLIFATLIPITFFMHAYWKESDAQAKQADQVMFNKNLGLMGGALGSSCCSLRPAANLGWTDHGPAVPPQLTASGGGPLRLVALCAAVGG